MNKIKVLLAGATGYLGKHIAAELKRQDYPARIIARNINKVPYDTRPFECFEAEATKPETLGSIMEGVDVVISALGITRQKDGLTYMDVDYRANMNLLREAKKHGVKRFIYVSALNADRLQNLKICAAKEKFVRQLEMSGMDYCIIRPNAFFSDMEAFLEMAKKGKVSLFGDGSFEMNPIHGADLAKLCVGLIESTENYVEAGGPEVLSHKEIAEIAFRTLGKSPKIKYMPEWLRKSILGITRTFTSSKTYGPMEFFFTVLAMDMVAPCYGEQRLSDHYYEIRNNI